MSVLISHGSALERLRAVPPANDMSTIPEGDISVRELGRSESRGHRFDPHAFGVRNRPVHISVGIHAGCSISSSVVTHRLSMESIPASLVRELGEGVYLTGPELTFAMMARRLSPVGLVALGYELCGGYSHFAPLVSGYYERGRLTTKEKIERALGRVTGLGCMKRTRDLLRYVGEGSASPTETCSSCMLTLPSDMGGAGYIAGRLNYEVRFDKTSQKVAGTKSARIDLAWPEQKVGIEYDSAEYHTSPAKDRRRREALLHEGWQIFTVDLDQLRDFGELKKTIELLADKVPRQRGWKQCTDQDMENLLQKVLKATRFGMGMHAALFPGFVEKGDVKMHL